MNRWLQPWMFVAGKPCSTFQVCGVAGIAAAAALAALLADRTHLSAWVIAAMFPAAIVTFLVLAMSTKIWCGQERLVYYHHEIAVLGVVAAAVRLLDHPVAPSLDVAALALGTFLAFGRIGCLMVGCCHGKPARHGVRYGPQHAREGFPACYVGATLFPVQLLESALVAAIVAIGVVVVFRGSPAGSAFAWYVSAYAMARFALEFLRGDAERRWFAGFTEAQWTSLAVAGAAALRFPMGRAAFSCIAVSMFAAAAARVFRGGRNVRSSLHVRELADALSSAGNDWVVVRSTSLGVHVSSGVARDRGGLVRHYALSGCDAREAAALARIILRLKHGAAAPVDLVAGAHGVYHMLVRENRHA